MKKVLFPLTAVFFTAFILFTFNACVDKDFDEPIPTVGIAPVGVEVNATIAELKAMGPPNLEEGITNITDDVIVAGSVTTSDETGNFHKEIFIQDETGGLRVVLDVNDIYNDYKEGTKVYVKCKGLDMDKFSNMYTLGLGVNNNGFLGRIPPAIIPDHLFPGETGQFITPNVVSIGDIVTNSNILGTLVTLENVEFADDLLGSTFAEEEETQNRDLLDCNGSGIVLRNNGYATFWEDPLPCGNGTITGIANKFLEDYQMFISRPTDLVMSADRCDGSTGTGCEGGGTGNEVEMSIADIRALFTGTDTNAPAETKIKGTIISDKVGNNINELNIVIQDGTGGILVRFDSDHALNLNDEVEIIISGEEISEYNGLLQINGVPVNNATAVDFGNVSPVTITIADLLADFENYESTLVRIENSTLTGGGVYSDNLSLNDGTADIDLFTWSVATFGSSQAPTNGEDVSLVAIVSEFTADGDPQGHQLMIRNENDVTATGGGGGGGNDCDVDENFSSGTSGSDINLAEWTNVAVEGDRWQINDFQGNIFAQVTAFGSAAGSEHDAWLVTPEINLSTQQIMNFKSAKAHWNHDGLSVWFSSDFSGNVETANWEELDPSPTLANDPDDDTNYDWVNSGAISLPLGGTGYIAFRYEGVEGEAAQQQTTFRIDDFTICEE